MGSEYINSITKTEFSISAKSLTRWAMQPVVMGWRLNDED